jgi:hypothetical protein
MSGDGSVPLVMTHERVAEECGIGRTAARRALAELSRVGFCRISSRPGQGGATTITLPDPGHLEVHDYEGVNVPITSSLAISSPPSRPFEIVDPGHLEPVEMLCESLADHGDRGHLKSSILAISGQKAPNPRARDLDLRRSSDPDLGSDPRSTTSRDLTRSENKKVPDPGPGQEHMADPPSEDQVSPAKRTRIDPEKIPPRAWAAADYLRTQVMVENPAAIVGTKSWGGESGLRLSWANAFRLLGQRLLQALRNADLAATEQQAWDEIARTVHWLFHGQPVSPRFVVESPDSLREKWDKIQAQRRNGARAAGVKLGADRRTPDPGAGRVWKTGDDWGGGK